MHFTILALAELTMNVADDVFLFHMHAFLLKKTPTKSKLNKVSSRRFSAALHLIEQRELTSKCPLSYVYILCMHDGDFFGNYVVSLHCTVFRYEPVFRYRPFQRMTNNPCSWFY